MMQSDIKDSVNNIKNIYSVVLPVYNEEQCLQEVINRIMKVLKQLGEPFEIVCIDDGSSDNTWPMLLQMSRVEPSLRGIKFLRNFGHQLAVYAGIKYCTGEYIAILDADGQDPPEILPQLFQKCREGYDVVYAVRKKRKENLLKRAGYKLFYRLYRFLVPFDVPLDSGDFAVFNKNVASFIQSLNEKTPVIRGLRSWYGGRQCGIEYARPKRVSGKSKYNLGKLLLLAINASISFSKKPLRIISLFGINISLFSFCGGIILLMMKLTVGIHLTGWTSLALLIMFFGGLILLVLGIIGEYIGDIYDEVKNRPAFLVKETIGWPHEPR